MRNVINSWANSDPTAAAEWLKTFPEGKSRDQGLESYVDRLSYQQPEFAAAATALITDEKSRYQRVENLARQWLMRDSEVAQKWLNQVSLPADRKERLLKSVPKR